GIEHARKPAVAASAAGMRDGGLSARRRRGACRIAGPGGDGGADGNGGPGRDRGADGNGGPGRDRGADGNGGPGGNSGDENNADENGSACRRGGAAARHYRGEREP